MNFAIIAAGDGSRLKTEGIEASKPMVKVAGIPLIERAINNCLKNNAASISCIINRHSPDLFDYLTGLILPIPFYLLVKTTPSSMHSLYELKKYLSGKPFLLMTTDSIYNENEFEKFVRLAETEDRYKGIIAVTSYIDDEKPLYTEVDEYGKIVSFSDNENKSGLVTGGLYYFKEDIFGKAGELLKANVCRLRNLLKSLTAENYSMKAFSFSKIIDVDHASDIEKAEEFLRGI